MPNDAFSLWNFITDALDPTPDSEKVHLKEDSEENTVIKPAPESEKVYFKEESEEKTVQILPFQMFILLSAHAVTLRWSLGKVQWGGNWTWKYAQGDKKSRNMGAFWIRKIRVIK